ncbi:hypothetical protein RJT34_32803 [Clitoria ternatea]|uniref:Uncharacterized protein n=1 Tax=Clitoria ternatea TaxID=43366 RepID=A0AAN9EWN6_CLITE
MSDRVGFVWSEPIASTTDHGIPVRETTSLSLRTCSLLSYTLYYSITLHFPVSPNFQGDPHSPAIRPFFLLFPSVNRRSVTNVS